MIVFSRIRDGAEFEQARVTSQTWSGANIHLCNPGDTLVFIQNKREGPQETRGCVVGFAKVKCMRERRENETPEKLGWNPSSNHRKYPNLIEYMNYTNLVDSPIKIRNDFYRGMCTYGRTYVETDEFAKVTAFVTMFY